MALIKIKQVNGLSADLAAKALGTDLTNEATARSNADFSLDAYIDAVSTEATTGVSEEVFSLDAYIDGVSGDLDTEEVTRSNADFSLDAYIDSVSSDLDDLDTNTNTALGGLSEDVFSLDAYIDSVSSDLGTEEVTRSNADFSLDAYIDGVSGDLSTEIVATNNDITGLVAREVYADEETSGLTVNASTQFNVTFAGPFLDAPYDYELYINGLKIGASDIVSPLAGNSVAVILPYAIEPSDVFAIKAVSA